MSKRNMTKENNLRDYAISNAYEPVNIIGNMVEYEKMLKAPVTRRVLSLFLIKDELDYNTLHEIVNVKNVKLSQALQLLRIAGFIIKTNRTTIKNTVIIPFYKVENKNVIKSLLIGIEKEVQFIADKEKLLSM